jgi:hypothetical protein
VVERLPSKCKFKPQYHKKRERWWAPPHMGLKTGIRNEEEIVF